MNVVIANTHKRWALARCLWTLECILNIFKARAGHTLSEEDLRIGVPFCQSVLLVHVCEHAGLQTWTGTDVSWGLGLRAAATKPHSWLGGCADARRNTGLL